VFRCGEAVLIRGPNGSGKTTLLKIASLIYRPTSGRVYADGLDFWELGEGDRISIKRRVAYVHDRPIMLRGSVEYNITYGLWIRGIGGVEARERCWGVMEELGIESLAGASAYSLSAGQTHLVAIARALAVEPEIIFLDEPFTYLDSRRKSLLVEALRKRRISGHGLVIVSHDVEAAMGVGIDRVVDMEEISGGSSV